jgi:hypothetical protein
MKTIVFLRDYSCLNPSIHTYTSTNLSVIPATIADSILHFCPDSILYFDIHVIHFHSSSSSTSFDSDLTCSFDSAFSSDSSSTLDRVLVSYQPLAVYGSQALPAGTDEIQKSLRLRISLSSPSPIESGVSRSLEVSSQENKKGHAEWAWPRSMCCIAKWRRSRSISG